MTEKFDNLHPETIALRAGTHRTEHGEHSDALYLTSSFVVEDAEDAALKFSGQAPGYTYSRFGNPTVSAFEERLAALDGAERAHGTASGMAAILALCMSHLKAGDHILASNGLFGATIQLFNNYMVKFGIEVSYVSPTQLQAWREAVRPNTRLFFTETPSNPLTDIADLTELAAIAHEHGAILAVDNSFCTPVLQRPLDFGADVVLYSATKYLDGQGRVLGGAISGSNVLIEPIYYFLRTAGPSLSPFNAWVLLKGLETLPLRMRAHSENAQKLAEWLESHPSIERVYYPWLTSHPQYALAQKQQTGGGGVVSFEVKGEREAAWRLINQVQLISRTSNLGDVRSTITHPATTTHGRLTPEARAAAGIREGLVRVAVGLEHIDDLIADLSRGLA